MVRPDDMGMKLVSYWCSLRGKETTHCLDLFYSGFYKVEQALSSSLFVTVIALTVFSIRLRYFAAIFSLSLLVFLGVVPPQELIRGVEWRLILFLIGSMILAYILRTLGVFRYIALVILRSSKGSSFLFLLILSLISWFLAVAVDEATSIIYVVMLLLDLRRLIKIDILPLILVSVLATNTGSMALPIGNPIGLYLAFTTGLHVVDFFKASLPLSLIALLALVLTERLLLKSYLYELVKEVKAEKIDIMLTQFYTALDKRGRSVLIHGLILLCGFIIIVSLSSFIAELLSLVYGAEVDPHSLLSFIPYIFVFLSLGEFDPEKLERVLMEGVEWPSLFFFVALFMLGHSLIWTGIAIRIAYFMGSISIGMGEVFLKLSILIITALTSAFLDNLSVVVAFTPVAGSLVNIGIPRGIYWSLLYGGVLGGNFTPIGSTANIVAIGVCEKHRMKFTWRYWVKIALIPSLLELLVANIWVLLIY
ncbi:MAG: SLC13 family permease [Desulfurococcaceae archaeon]